MKPFFKKLLRKPAIIVVSLWAKHVFNLGVNAAESRHRKTGVTVYLAADSFHPNRLVTYTKEQFKVEKRAYGQAARLLTMNTLRQRCYYYTADKYGNNGLSKRETAVRKGAFVKERLRKAGLV